MQSVVGVCFALILASLLLVLGAIRPSRARVAIATYLILSFTTDPSTIMKLELAELCYILIAPFDVLAWASVFNVMTSDAVAISHARGLMLLTSWTLLVARYALTFCLMASLTNASAYFLAVSTSGQAKLYASLRGMILGSAQMSARNTLFAAVLMTSNIVASMVLAVGLILAAETEGTPVSKKAITAAAHSVVGQAMPVGSEGKGVFELIRDDHGEFFTHEEGSVWQSLSELNPVNVARKHFLGTTNKEVEQQWVMPRAWHSAVERKFQNLMDSDPALSTMLESAFLHATTVRGGAITSEIFDRVIGMAMPSAGATATEKADALTRTLPCVVLREQCLSVGRATRLSDGFFPDRRPQLGWNTQVRCTSVEAERAIRHSARA